MSTTVIFYKGGMLVCDAGTAIQPAIDKLAVSILTGESSAIIVNVAKGSAPTAVALYDTYGDAKLVSDLRTCSRSPKQ